MGDIVVKLPLPLEHFNYGMQMIDIKVYMSTYKGYYQTYDAGHIDEDGYVWITKRRYH